jgi:uncharacterized lipoprotein YddW (UPF0748 family)
MNQLRRLKPDWLSRDITGSEIAPNGFVWMNPLHPEVRRFLLDLVLEAIDRYDLDGIQLDDRIVWPYVTMGYDKYTRQIYANEHAGREPPADPNDAAWMRWRAEKVDAYAKQFVREVHARRPTVQVSLSPAVYPWSWEHYLLDWPSWAAWDSKHDGARWDEFIPQVYRNNFAAFAKTWEEQVAAIAQRAPARQRDLLAGIRVVGEGSPSTWEDLARSIQLTRATNAGGHVLWFSRGVLDLYPAQLKSFYNGWTHSPRFPPDWRAQSIPLSRMGPVAGESSGPSRAWYHPALDAGGAYRVVGFDGKRWRYLDRRTLGERTATDRRTYLYADDDYLEVELVIDRRYSALTPKPYPR